jgi:hypothetical protein
MYVVQLISVIPTWAPQMSLLRSYLDHTFIPSVKIGSSSAMERFRIVRYCVDYEPWDLRRRRKPYKKNVVIV